MAPLLEINGVLVELSGLALDFLNDRGAHPEVLVRALAEDGDVEHPCLLAEHVV